MYRRRHRKVEVWVCCSCFLPTNSFLQLESMVLHSGYPQRNNSTEIGLIPDDEPPTIFENTLRLPTVRKVPQQLLDTLVSSNFPRHLQFQTPPPVLDKLLSTEFSTSLGTQTVPLFPLVQKPHWRIWWRCYTSIQAVLTPAILRNFHLAKFHLQTLRLGPLCKPGSNIFGIQSIRHSSLVLPVTYMLEIY